MNYLITGFPGTGKSSIAIELQKRGHTAYDPQAMRTFMHVEDRVTGRHIHAPSEVPSGWYDIAGAYNWDTAKLERLLRTPGDVYICSKSHNQDLFYDRFEKIFLLTLDFTLLIERLRNRPGKSIGKTSPELSDILVKSEHFERSLLNKGAIGINMAQPINLVVDSILKLTNS